MFQRELLIDEPGIMLGKKSQRLVVKKRGEVVEEIPIMELKDLIILSNGVTISSDLIQLLMEQGTQIHFLDYKENPYATLYSPFLHGTVKTRREQFASLSDQRGVQISKTLYDAKLKNQIITIKYFLRSRKDEEMREKLTDYINQIENRRHLLQQVSGESVDEIRQTLLNIEGLASQYYWKGVKVLLQDKISFPGREPWEPKDPVNMMLNFGYGIVSAKVMGAIIRAGLEPFAGFIHTDRAGKVSLRHDCIEEFRQPLVDRVVIALLSRGFQPGIKESEDGYIGLDDATRKILREHIYKKLDSREKYKGKRYLWQTIIQMQARELATYFREGKSYQCHVVGW